jgi:hypothetical protein
MGARQLQKSHNLISQSAPAVRSFWLCGTPHTDVTTPWCAFSLPQLFLLTRSHICTAPVALHKLDAAVRHHAWLDAQTQPQRARLGQPSILLWVVLTSSPTLVLPVCRVQQTNNRFTLEYFESGYSTLACASPQKVQNSATHKNFTTQHPNLAFTLRIKHRMNTHHLQNHIQPQNRGILGHTPPESACADAPCTSQ